MSGGPQTFLDGRVVLHAGDCLAVLKTLPEACVDSVVTDPPYHLTSIVKRFSAAGAAPPKEGKTGAYARAARGFMGQAWDGGDIAFTPELWAEVLRVLKPGGFCLAFSATRTYHRMACAIEDAGFEIHDMVAWVYGCGFPKSHNISKAIDKAAGIARIVVGQETLSNDIRGGALLDAAHGVDRPALVRDITIATSDAARKWEGWGTALKPALEPICFVQKPLSEKTIAGNVLVHGTGALNIDACRVEGEALPQFSYFETGAARGYDGGIKGGARNGLRTNGRWPANVVHDGSEDVLAAFPGDDDRFSGYAGAGSAARFFYSAKADSDDRIGSKHPTVKPVDLMAWLVRLVTPPGGTVLDPFAGTGTTGEAAWREGFSAVLIEREEAYRTDIARRMALAVEGRSIRAAESAKARGAPSKPAPLFGLMEGT